jgi:hypothetical protein
MLGVGLVMSSPARDGAGNVVIQTAASDAGNVGRFSAAPDARRSVPTMARLGADGVPAHARIAERGVARFAAPPGSRAARCLGPARCAHLVRYGMQIERSVPSVPVALSATVR